MRTNTGKPMDDMIPADQVAQRLGVGAATLALWRRRKRGPRFHRVSGQIFYHCADVAEWLEGVRAFRAKQHVEDLLRALIEWEGIERRQCELRLKRLDSLRGLVEELLVRPHESESLSPDTDSPVAQA